MLKLYLLMNGPDGTELYNATKKYVNNIHMYDGRHANRCISRWD